MATELPSTTIVTPDLATTVTPVIKRPIIGRIFDAVAVLAAFVVALLASLGDINFAALGLTSTQASWAGLAVFVVRFALTYRPVKLVGVKVEPTSGGQG